MKEEIDSVVMLAVMTLCEEHLILKCFCLKVYMEYQNNLNPIKKGSKVKNYNLHMKPYSLYQVLMDDKIYLFVIVLCDEDFMFEFSK